MMLQIIHDVKHPLVNIDMYTDLIKEDSIAPSDLEGTKHVQVIQENIIRLQDQKRQLADSILSGDGMSSGTFDKEELLELLG